MAAHSYSYLHNERLNPGNSSDNSNEFDSSATETSSTDEDYEPIWSEKVGTKGDLFYFEPSFIEDLSEETSASADKAKDVKTVNEKFIHGGTRSKPTEKIRQWVKHRKKKIKKRFRQSPQRSNSVSKKSSIPKPKLNNYNVGKTKEIAVNVDIHRYNYGRRATLAEKLFGLVLIPIKDCPSIAKTVADDDDRIIVKEVLHKENFGELEVGDWLKLIEGKDVTCENINAVLENLKSPCTVKLVFHSLLDYTSEDLDKTNNNLLFDHIIGKGQTFEKMKSMYSHLPYVIFYLATVPESSKDDDDIVYSYPNTKSSLTMLKGMFMTLSHMIADVATPPVLSCTVSLQEEIVHAGFMKEGEELMVIALPVKCANLLEVEHFAKDVGKILKLQFSTLSHAFCDSDNKDYLDCFFSYFFHQTLSGFSNGKPKSHLINILPSIHWFPLPSDIKIVVDDILCQFESADFGDDSEGYYGIRRIYNILGSCLFHKGYLLGSHLDKEDLLDIHLFLNCHGILSLTATQPLQRAIIWKEIYPSRKQNKPVETDPNYIETDGRYFLLIVAMKYNIMATILEAGGCALIVSGFPSPEPFYVEQVEGTLMLLDESGIFPTVGKLMDSQDPPLGYPEMFLKAVEKSNWDKLTSIVGLSPHSDAQKSVRRLSRRSHSYSNLSGEDGKKMFETSSILKKRCDEDYERQLLLSHMGPADGESDEEGIPIWPSSDQKRIRRCSTSTSSNTGSHCSEENINAQANAGKNRFNSSYDLRGYSSQDHLETAAIRDHLISSKLVVGCENTLFYYLHMDPAEGIFLAPTSQAQKLFTGSVGQDIIQNFYKCCLQMRTVFERSLRNKQLSMNAVVPKFGLNKFLQAAYEQGALIQCNTLSGETSKKASLTLSFWVIGRLFFAPEPREVYVCYHDSTRQNVVEMAFRLGFGLLL